MFDKHKKDDKNIKYKAKRNVLKGYNQSVRGSFDILNWSLHLEWMGTGLETEGDTVITEYEGTADDLEKVATTLYDRQQKAGLGSAGAVSKSEANTANITKETVKKDSAGEGKTLEKSSPVKVIELHVNQYRAYFIENGKSYPLSSLKIGGSVKIGTKMCEISRNDKGKCILTYDGIEIPEDYIAGGEYIYTILLK